VPSVLLMAWPLQNVASRIWKQHTARTEGAKLVAEAKSQIDQEVLRAKEALREQVAGLAVAGAEKILRKEIDAAKHADLLASIKAEF